MRTATATVSTVIVSSTAVELRRAARKALRPSGSSVSEVFMVFTVVVIRHLP